MHPSGFFLLIVCAYAGKTALIADMMATTASCDEARTLYSQLTSEDTTITTILNSLDAVTIPFLKTLADCTVSELTDPNNGMSLRTAYKLDFDVAQFMLTPRIQDFADDAKVLEGDPAEVFSDERLNGMLRACKLNVAHAQRYPPTLRVLMFKLTQMIPRQQDVCVDLRVLYELLIESTEPALDMKKREIDESVSIRDGILRLNTLASEWQGLFAEFKSTVEKRGSKLQRSILELLNSTDRALIESAKNAMFMLYTTSSAESAFLAMFELYVFYSRRISIIFEPIEFDESKTTPLVIIAERWPSASRIANQIWRAHDFNVLEEPKPIREDRDRLMKFFTLIEEARGARPELLARCRTLAGYTTFAQSNYNEESLPLDRYPFLTQALARVFELCDYAQAQRLTSESICFKEPMLASRDPRPRVCTTDNHQLGSKRMPIDFIYAARMFGFVTFHGQNEHAPAAVRTARFFGSTQPDIFPVALGTYRWTNYFKGSECEEDLQSVEQTMGPRSSAKVWIQVMREQLDVIPDAEDLSLCLYLSIVRLVNEIHVACLENVDSKKEDGDSIKELKFEVKSLRNQYVTDLKLIGRLAVEMSKQAWNFWEGRPDIVKRFQNPRAHEYTASVLSRISQRTVRVIDETIESWEQQEPDTIMETLLRNDIRLFRKTLFSLHQEFALLMYRAINKMVMLLHNIDYDFDEADVVDPYMVSTTTVETRLIVDTAGALLTETLGEQYSCLANFKSEFAPPREPADVDGSNEPVKDKSDLAVVPDFAEPDFAGPELEVEPVTNQLIEETLESLPQASATVKYFDEFMDLNSDPTTSTTIRIKDTFDDFVIQPAAGMRILNHAEVCTTNRLGVMNTICLQVIPEILQFVSQ